MGTVIDSTLPLFFLMLLGAIIKRKWILSEEFWRGLERLLYFLLFPAMMFNSIATASFKTAQTSSLIIALVCANVLISVMMFFYYKRYPHEKAQFTSIFQGVVRYNSYTFFGMSSALFGAEGSAIVAVVASYMIGITNILSVIAFAAVLPTNKHGRNNKQDFVLLSLKLIFTNPLIIASILGFLVNYSGATLDLSIRKTVSSLGAAALAIAMLNIGAGLKFTAIKSYYNQVIFTSVCKLCIFPVITFIVLILMSVDGTERSIGILYSALPCASSAYVLSRQLGGDTDLMAAIISTTNILSVFSIPIILYLFV